MSLCVGFDDVLHPPAIIRKFENVDYVKINVAYHNEESISEIKDFVCEKGIKLIIDCKIGDIDKTQTAYLEKYSFADFITVNPYMGMEVLNPFLNMGTNIIPLVLLLTSNKGRSDFQTYVPETIFEGQVLSNGPPLYIKVLKKCLEWIKFKRLVGFVIGATIDSNTFCEIISLTYKYLEFLPPILIPGIGRQGGKCTPVLNSILKGLRLGGCENKGQLRKEIKNVILSNSSGIMRSEDPLEKIMEMHLEIDKLCSGN